MIIPVSRGETQRDASRIFRNSLIKIDIQSQAFQLVKEHVQ